LYVVGYSSSPPPFSDLRDWFNLEYGGPIKFKDGRQEGAELDIHFPVLATHGPWSAYVRISLPTSEADEWRNQLSWRHPDGGSVGTITAVPREMSDLVLHAARLARGLTLLTAGTAYDITTQAYLNPSDWQDHPLAFFQIGNHITVRQGEAVQPDKDWFYTRGLSKFGLDEIEVFQPLGLPNRSVIDNLIGIADEVVRLGYSPKVGTTISIPDRGLSVQIIRHRTVSADIPLILREVKWHS